jgi:tetratricopeptide (TPR) repeat protein
MGIFQNKNTRVIILVMVTLVVVSLVVSKLYYQNINNSIDPRVVEARKLYSTYNDFAANNDFISIFTLLDSIEAIYNGIEHYKQSFEMGVLSNNRAAVYLTLAIHKDSIELSQNNISFKEYSKDSLLQLAKHEINNAIEIYTTWNKTYGKVSKEVCLELIKPEFLKGLEKYDEADQQKFLKNRVDAYMQNQIEINRRLSVSYTNLGIIYRHAEQYDSAVLAYAEAIKLWDRNLTAENNLNILMGRPLKKQNIISKLFPPDPDKDKQTN